MKVVLNADIKGIGKKLSIVEVSEGYARNYLIPRKLASQADNRSLNEAKEKSDALKYKKDTEKQEAEKMKKLIDTKSIKFNRKIGENGKLFGSVTEKEISDMIKKEFGIEIDKRKITMESSIKELGTYVAKIKLYEGIIANLRIVVLEM